MRRIKAVVYGVGAMNSIATRLYARNTAPMQAAELDRLARQNAVTITGTGRE